MPNNTDRESEKLLDELSQMIADARSFPISAGKCIIDRNEALDILDAIRTNLPRELEEARRLVAGKKSYITNAKQEAELIKKTAEERSRQLIDDQEVLKMAQAESRTMLADAEGKSRDMKQRATEYIGQTLKTSEDSLAAALEVISKTRAQYETALKSLEQPELLED